MRLKSLLFLLAVCFGLQADAQMGPWVTDTVYMGNGYANDVYYHLHTKTVKTEANSNWHLAFAAGVLGRNVAIFANHVGGGVSVYNFNKAVNQFGTNLSADTTAAKNNPLYNSITDYINGAFNKNISSSSPFDFGWGTYDMTTHYVNGDDLYFVKTPAGKYQVWIELYKSAPTDSMSWTFHIANVDGSGRVDQKVYAKPYLNNIFVYYNITTNSFAAREPGNQDWDMLFTRYNQDISGVQYPSTGVMTNYNTGVAELWDVDADTAEYRNYTMDSSTTAIGSDWKKAPMGPVTVFDLDTVTYFVKSRNASIYQVEFLYATTGSAGGKIALRKRVAVPLSIPAVEGKVNSFNMFPNPASAGQANLLIDMVKAEKVQVLITDITGKTVLYKAIDMKAGLNALALNTGAYTAGTYMVTITNGSWKTSDKLIIQD